MHFAKLHDLMLIEFHYISHDCVDISTLSRQSAREDFKANLNTPEKKNTN